MPDDRFFSVSSSMEGGFLCFFLLKKAPCYCRTPCRSCDVLLLPYITIMAAAINGFYARASSMTAAANDSCDPRYQRSFSQSAGIRHCASDADDTDASEEADAASLLSDAVADDASAEVLSEPVFCSVT